MTVEPVNPFDRGPFVQVAALCERVLREADGVVSLIRLVDVVTHTEHGPNAPADMPEIHYPLMLVLVLKSGVSRGRHDITIIPELPSAERLNPMTMSVNMEGGSRGVSIITRLDMVYKLEGLYWFNVQFDGRPITRIALEVRYSRMVTGQATQTP
ncbi:MAG: hypothetical protein HYX87_05485 [Chloroflexi bacterium]|nr:hypothetical protein [Chloroflexota bacterium]